MESPSKASPFFSYCFTSKTEEEEEQDKTIYHKYEDLISTLPNEDFDDKSQLCKYQNSWIHKDLLRGLLVAKKRLVTHPDDIILATFPKAGTTWLKAMTFSIVNRDDPAANATLRSMNPHQLFPFVEMLYMGISLPDMETLPPPRIFCTHAPYCLLPDSFKDSDNTKIVYLCREPKDTFVSRWHFMNKLRATSKDEAVKQVSVEEAFETYCSGKFLYGPVWEHALGYWNEHQKEPGKVLFLKYEDAKTNNIGTLRRLAEFMGFPFLEEEEAGGVVERICKMCSFESLSNMEGNKKGESEALGYVIETNAYFRKGEVGDWKNHLTSEMTRRIDGITQEKLHSVGLFL